MFQLFDTSWHNMDVKQHGTVFICKVESESGETKEDSAWYLRKMQEKEKCIKHIFHLLYFHGQKKESWNNTLQLCINFIVGFRSVKFCFSL